MDGNPSFFPFQQLSDENDGIIQENSYVGIGRFGALTNNGHGHETIPIDFPMQ